MRQMQYPRCVGDGWPIGSGMVESANTLGVEARGDPLGEGCGHAWGSGAR